MVLPVKRVMVRTLLNANQTYRIPKQRNFWPSSDNRGHAPTVSFGDETALIYPWQIVIEAR